MTKTAGSSNWESAGRDNPLRGSGNGTMGRLGKDLSQTGGDPHRPQRPRQRNGPITQETDNVQRLQTYRRLRCSIPSPRISLTWGQKLGPPGKPYLTRWVLDLGFVALRVHHWQASDDLRAPHDHAWDFWSLLLKGELWDRTPSKTGGYTPDPKGVSFTDTPRKRFVPEFYSAEHRHSVVVGPQGAWTFLVTLPPRREWGFWVPKAGGKEKGLVRFRHRNKYFHEQGHH